ncbi:MAG: hypothetical protein ACP5HQ_06395 [Thermoprotei archaeon]
MKVPFLERVSSIRRELYNLKVWPAQRFADGGIGITGEFIITEANGHNEILFWSNGSLYAIENGKVNLRLDNAQALGFIAISHKVVAVERKNGKYYVGNEKFDGYWSKYGFQVLRSSRTALVVTPYAVLELERPDHVSIFPTHVSLIYGSESIAVDPWGNKRTWKKGMHYVGETKDEWVFYSPAGRIEVAGKRGLADQVSSITFCSETPYLIGSAFGQAAVLCGDTLKVREEGGWLSKGASFGVLRLAYHDGVVTVLKSRELLIEQPDSSDTRIWVEDAKSVAWISESIYAIVKDYVVKVKFVECGEALRARKDTVDGNPALLEKSGCLTEFRATAREPIVVINDSDGEISLDTKVVNKAIIDGEVTLTDGLIYYRIPVRLKVQRPEVSLESVKLRRAKGGHPLGDPSSNAILKARIRAYVPSTLPYKLLLTCCGSSKEFVQFVKTFSGELEMNVNTFEDRYVRLSVSIINADGEKQTTYEYTVPIEDVQKPNVKPEKLITYTGASVWEIERVKDGEFAWDVVRMHPLAYYGVRIVKKGSIIRTGDREIRATEAHETTDELGRSVLVVPVESPLARIEAVVKGHDLVITPKCARDEVIIEAFYAGRVKRVLGCGEMTFPLDPFYNQVIINVYFYGLVWTEKLRLTGLNPKAAFTFAEKVSDLIKDMLSKNFVFP